VPVFNGDFILIPVAAEVAVEHLLPQPLLLAPPAPLAQDQLERIVPVH